MPKRGLPFIFLFLAFAIFLCPALGYGDNVANQLDEKTLALIGDAVFEVVVPKPVQDSLTYEKPLPLDLIPFAIRNDKYYSMGTAFAIGPDQFITAAHVMWNLSQESQFKDAFLRDSAGNIYSIEKISKYSDHRDFVVFSLKNKKVSKYFSVNNKPKLNGKVFAVGNALGEGIVVRDGLYTSNTPEEVDGAWKWIRFSAAASPGNSGGPLLDEQGKVIGIVLQKSENENLNYALPITEVLQAKANTASSYRKLGYTLENMDFTKMATKSTEFPLPATFKELREKLIQDDNRFTQKMLKDLLQENKAEIFPNGPSSEILLNRIVIADFPRLIMKDEDKNWDAFYHTDLSTSELRKNGYLKYDVIGETLLVQMHKPDDVALMKFYSDSKLFGDFFLQGYNLYREIGSQKIRITSMGKATQERQHTDSYGRKWIIRTWPLEYVDEKIVAFLLPVPGGFVGMMKKGDSGVIDNGAIPDLKVLTDFVYLSYSGKLKEWDEFLKCGDLLPSVFSKIQLEFKSGKLLSYRSQKLAFKQGTDIISVRDDNELQLLFGYYRENGKVIWDTGGIIVSEAKGNKNSYSIYRRTRPSNNLRDAYKKEWESVVKKEFPFNNSAFNKDGTTIILNVHGSEVPKSPSVLYTIGYAMNGTADQKEMEEHLKKLDDSITILEANTKAKDTKVGKAY